MSAPLWNTTPI